MLHINEKGYTRDSAICILCVDCMNIYIVECMSIYLCCVPTCIPTACEQMLKLSLVCVYSYSAVIILMGILIFTTALKKYMLCYKQSYKTCVQMQAYYKENLSFHANYL